MPNFPGWAFAIRANGLKKYLSSKYQLTIKYSATAQLKLKDLNSYQIIYLFYWRDYEKFPFDQCTAKLILGIHSHQSWRKIFWLAIKTFKKAGVVLVSTKILQRKFAPYLSNLYYLPHEADHHQFYPKKSNQLKAGEKLILGWAGDPDYNQGREKGYYDIILPLLKKFKGQVKLRVATFKHSKVPHHKMVAFYNSIHLYLNASRTEGGPLPCFEAAACGRPIISTYSGSMPEFIKNGVNGFLVKRNITSFYQTVKKFLTQPKLLEKLGQGARKEIEKNWNLEKRAREYDHLWQKLLTHKE